MTSAHRHERTVAATRRYLRQKADIASVWLRTISENEMLKTYQGYPHGMPTTKAETINADILAFLQA